MKTETFELPTHWATALMYGEMDGFEDEEQLQIEAFEKWMTKKYDSCWCVEVDSWRTFQRMHDASFLGVSACDVSKFTFDITPE